MQKILFGLIAIALIGCASRTASPSQADSTMPNHASLPDLGPAPELTTTTWLNVDSPLRLADLRGKVVIIDMWTFG
jgi:hypothetical protein